MTAPLAYTLTIQPYGDLGVMWSIEAPDGKLVGSWRTSRSGYGVWLEVAGGAYHQMQGTDAFHVAGIDDARRQLRPIAVSQAKTDARFLVAGRENARDASDDVMYGDHPVTIKIVTTA